MEDRFRAGPPSLLFTSQQLPVPSLQLRQQQLLPQLFLGHLQSESQTVEEKQILEHLTLGFRAAAMADGRQRALDQLYAVLQIPSMPSMHCNSTVQSHLCLKGSNAVHPTRCLKGGGSGVEDSRVKKGHVGQGRGQPPAIRRALPRPCLHRLCRR